MAEMIAVIQGSVSIVEIVRNESQFVLRGGDGEEAKEREPVELRQFISTGAITVMASNDESELMTFIDLTLELDDGEAMTAAVAIHRGGIVVTDDRKASRVLQERNVPLLSTLDVCKNWVASTDEAPEFIRAALIAIRERGRYEPPKRHPLRSWWDAILQA